MPAAKARDLLKQQWQGRMSDYVTAIAWSPDGSTLAASSACGEVVLYETKLGTPQVLQAQQGHSIDALSFSSDGMFLAAGGQDGTVLIWQVGGECPQIVDELKHSRVWVDRLQWHPYYPQLVFSLGRYAQVWDASTRNVVATLNFEVSSVLDLAWHPQGESLSVSGNQIVKTWQRQQWDDDPQLRETGGASGAIAWSPDGTYLASGNHDRSLLVWELSSPHPWRMQGFPGKVRQLTWSMPTTPVGAPLLASMSAERIVTWTKDPDPAVGWKARVLDWHCETVTAIAFQPNTLLLASASEDGWVCLWKKATQVAQILQGAPKGFSCLSWHPQGTSLAAGGQEGEVLVWTKSTRGKGFQLS